MRGTIPPGIALAVCLPLAAWAASPPPVPSLTSEGSLLVSREGKVVKVPLKHTVARLRVSGHLVEGTVTQVFENPYPDKIEAVYFFPLPTDAAMQDFSLKNGERVLRGRLLRRQEARAVYQRASRSGQVAALLEQERPNCFTQTVANLEPGKRVEVTLRYVGRLRYEAGAYELIFPMVVGPRFVPQQRGKRGALKMLSPPVLPPDQRSAHDIDLSVEIEAGLAVERLHSPSHHIHSRTRAPSAIRVTLDRGDRIPNKDFILRYRVAGDLPRAGLVTERPAAGDPGHLLLMVQPPEGKGVRQTIPRELIFVLDTSSSMTGAPLAQAKRLVSHLLTGLGPEDTFQLVRFDERAASLGQQMIASKPANLKIAGAWLDRLGPRGGTMMSTGLKTAFTLPHDPARVRLVVFLSDGYIGNEEEVLRLVGRRLGAARLFAFGVGTAVNRYLLEELAALGRGEAQVVRPDEPLERAVSRFSRRISHPLLTDLAVTFEGLQVSSPTPARLPDLFAGQPLFLLGRFAGAGKGTAVIRGRRAGRAVEIRIPFHVPPGAHGQRALATAWARARIAEEERGLLRREDPAAGQRILELSLAHGILTRHTAFVVVDEDSFTAGKAVRVMVPVDRPEGLMRAAGRSGALGLMGVGYSAAGHGGGGGVGHGTIRLGRLSAIGKGGGSGMAMGYGRAMASSASGGLVGSSIRSSYGLRARLGSVPQILISPAIVRGSLNKDIVRRVIRAHLNEVRFCYERELSGNPRLAGRLTVQIVLDEGGRPTSSTLKESTMQNSAVEQCVVSAARRWLFPRASDGGLVVINYPFVFKPSDATRPQNLVAPHDER